MGTKEFLLGGVSPRTEQESLTIQPMPERVREVLLHVQTLQKYFKEKPREVNWVLVSEDRDWFMIYHWTLYHGFFKSNPERPRFAAFAKWVNEAGVVYSTTSCNADCLSRINRKLKGQCNPWENIPHVAPNILKRWRVLWRALEIKYISYNDSDSGEMPSTTQA